MSRTKEKLDRLLQAHPRKDVLTARYALLKDKNSQRLFVMARERILARKESQTDFLTGLLNRRGGEKAFRALHSHAYRHKLYIALIAIDLDKFKSVNDTYGHGAGDMVLKELARRLSQPGLLRESDVACRMGGEEFSVFLESDDPNNTALVAERLREAIKKEPFKVIDNMGKAHDLQVTGSMGISLCRPTRSHTCDMRDMGEEADSALYAAKEAGRDRVVISEASAKLRSLRPPKVELSQGELDMLMGKSGAATRPENIEAAKQDAPRAKAG